MRVVDPVQSDRALVDRCLEGDKSAWTRLYNQFQTPLMLAVRILLGRQAARHDLVEEIAAKVWFAVLDHDGKLLDRFDCARGCRLSTFLAGLAKNEISRYFRAERRRNMRETQVCRHRKNVAPDCHWHSMVGLTAAVAEFIATLTPREREYCEEFLLTRSSELLEDLSDTNRWQLQHRVREKLWTFVKSH